MSERDVAQRFMRARLGPDWDMLLVEADAHPIVNRNADIDAAEKRAVALICERAEDWRPGLRDAAAYAWHALIVRNDQTDPTKREAL
jgi:hypothetical protein